MSSNSTSSKSLQLFFRWQASMLFSLALLLAACTPLPTAPPPPTPEILVVARSLALQGWDEKIHSCAKSLPQLAVMVVDDPPADPAQISPQITLRLGNGSPPGEHTYLLAWENILLVANRAFPGVDLSLPQLQALITSHPDPSALETAAPQIQFWTFPAGDEAREIFEQAVFPSGSSLALASIAPDPSAMLEALAGDPSAIGYLPASALSLASSDQHSQLKILNLKEKPADILRQPIVAVLPATPSPLMNAFLQCLESSNY
jgi:hypothetical protein